MDQFGLLDLFSELRQVKVVVSQAGAVKLTLNGSAIVKKKPYLELTFPAEAWPELQALDQGSQVLVCLHTEDSVFFVNTTIARLLGEGRLLVQAEDFVQERYKRSAERVQAERIELQYWHLDEQGRALSEAKEAQPLDISSMGIRMRLEQVVEPYQMLGLKITIQVPPQATITCKAQIVRMGLKADSSIEIAVHFEEIDEQDRQRITDFCYGENMDSEEP
jgi:c-di-GMP-binding flagellar brake protein YcgR